MPGIEPKCGNESRKMLRKTGSQGSGKSMHVPLCAEYHLVVSLEEELGFPPPHLVPFALFMGKDEGWLTQSTLCMPGTGVLCHYIGKKWKIRSMRFMCMVTQVGGGEVTVQSQSSLSPKFTIFSFYSISSAQKMGTDLSNFLAKELWPYLDTLGTT